MAAACQTVRVTADLTMQVPRNATGDLESGVENVVRGVDSVADVADVDVSGLRPRLNDVQVDATVEVAMHLEDAPGAADASRAALEDGFGIEDVENVRADRADRADHAAAESGDPVQEYG